MVSRQRAREAVLAGPSSYTQGRLLWVLGKTSDQELATWDIDDDADNKTIWGFILDRARGALLGLGFSGPANCPSNPVSSSIPWLLPVGLPRRARQTWLATVGIHLCRSACACGFATAQLCSQSIEIPICASASICSSPALTPPPHRLTRLTE